MRPLPTPFQESLDVRTAFIPELEVSASRLGSTPVVFEPSSGRVTFDRRRTIHGDGELTIPTDELHIRPESLLTPFGTRIIIRLGVTLAAGVSATVPAGVFVVDASNADIAPTGTVVSLPLVDLAKVVADYRFESPFTVAAASDLATVVNAVILDRTGTSPALGATGVVLSNPRTFGLDPETDPWAELVQLVRGFGYNLWYDREGEVRLAQQSAGGTPRDIAPLTLATSFDKRPANVVVARGESTDPAVAPVQAVAVDDDPTSPTYAGTGPGSSPYGRVTRYYASPQLTTQAQADSAAASILDLELAAAAAWTVTRSWDPTVEPYDVVAVDTEIGPLQLLVDAVTINIGGTTEVACRELT